VRFVGEQVRRKAGGRLPVKIISLWHLMRDARSVRLRIKQGIRRKILVQMSRPRSICYSKVITGIYASAWLDVVVEGSIACGAHCIFQGIGTLKPILMCHVSKGW